MAQRSRSPYNASRSSVPASLLGYCQIKDACILSFCCSVVCLLALRSSYLAFSEFNPFDSPDSIGNRCEL